MEEAAITAEAASSREKETDKKDRFVDIFSSSLSPCFSYLSLSMGDAHSRAHTFHVRIA